MAEAISLFGKLAAKKGRKKKQSSGILSGVDAGIDTSSATAAPWSPAEVSEDFSRKPVGIFKPLDYLNRGQYAVVNPIRRLTDKRKDTPGEILGSIWKGLSGQERSSTTDVLQNLGWKPKTLKGKIARGAVGLAGDILLDPLTYIDIFQLTKLGKAAKVGAALKVGDTILDLRKAKDMAKATDMLGDAMKAMGKTDDAIKAAKNSFSGIRKSSLAKDMAEMLGQYGVKSESVKLAKNWYKQYKAGERAILQLSMPRILGGGSTRVPIIGDAMEEKFFQKASKKGAKIGAARAVTNEKVMKSIPELTEEALKSTKALNKEGKAVRFGGKLYDISGKEFDELGKAASKVLEDSGRTGEIPVLMEQLKKIKNGTAAVTEAEKGLNESSRIISTLNRWGLNADNGLKGMRHKEALARMAKGNELLGRTINDLAYGFNFIAKPIKYARRMATGESQVTANEAIENVTKLLGKDNQKLVNGAADFEDFLGGAAKKFTAKDDIAARIELEELLTHPIAWDDLSQKAAKKGGWQAITVDDVVDSLEGLIKGTERNKKAAFNVDAWAKWEAANKELAGKGKRLADPIEGLAEETVRRAQNTARRWNNVADMHDVGTALRYSEDMMNRMGAVKSSSLLSRKVLEGTGYSPHLLADSSPHALEGRLSHHGQTIFEAMHGHRTKESIDHLKRNFDSIFSYTSDGKQVTGKDLLPETFAKEYKNAYNKWSKAEVHYREKLAKLEKDATLSEKSLYDAKRYATGRLEAAQAEYKATLDSLIAEAQRAHKVDFSTDLTKNLATRIQGAQNRMQTRLVVDSIMKYGLDMSGKQAVPAGYVMLKDVLPDALPNVLRYTYDDADELLKAVDKIAVPYEFVKPLDEMLHVAKAEPGAASKIYDWALSVLKPFMLSSPATQMRNTLSSFSMAWAAGDFSNLVSRGNFGKAAKFCGTNFRTGGDAVVDILGRQYTLRELWDLFQRHGGNDMDSLVREYLEKPAAELTSKVAKGIKKGTDWITTPTSAWAQKTENTFRFNHFINELQQGSTIEDAIESVAMHFYDYGDLSRFEQKYMRKIFPFWTFWRKNLEANARYLVTNIGYVNTPLKAANELNQMTEGEEGTFPMEWLSNERQQWLANQGPFRTPWNKKIGTMQGILPQADVGNIVSPKDAFETLLGMISPVAKTPYELATNKDSFTGREISTPLKPTTYFLGMDMNPKAVHALRPFRVLSAVDNIIKAIEPGRAKAHGANVKYSDDMTMGEKVRSGLSDVFGFRSYLQDPEEVQLNKRMEVAKLIRRVDQYLEKNPNLDEDFRNDILKNRATLINELARTKTVEESGVPSEQLLKSVKRKGKR